MDGIHGCRWPLTRAVSVSCLAAVITLSSGAIAFAQEPPEGELRPLRVLWWEAVPLCFKIGNVLTGFGCEISEAVLTEAKLPYELIEVEGPAEGLEKLKSGEGDVTGVPVPQLSELEDECDYTHGIYETGVQIVASTELSAPRSLRMLLQATYLLELLGVAFLVLIVVAHAIWLIERKRPDSSFRPGYLHGIFDAFWWACVTATTVGYGDAVPRAALGRALALLWMFGALFLVTLFIGSITAVMTVRHLDRGIQTIEDLRGHEVGALAANPILERIRRRGVDPILYDTPGELFDAMTAGKLDALVHEWASASYYVGHEGKGRAVLAGPRFRRTKAALLLPEESPYREVLDRAILRIVENGLYEQIHARWFPEITGASQN